MARILIGLRGGRADGRARAEDNLKGFNLERRGGVSVRDNLARRGVISEQQRGDASEPLHRAAPTKR